MRFLLLILLTALPSLATVRTWRNVDGSQSFDAEFLSTDGVRVTLKRSADNRILTFTSEKLHPDDQAWLKANSQPTPDAPEEEAPAGAAFDTLEFGDDRKTVEAKLKNSSLLSTVVDESLFGRTGLNGVYKTKATIGGLHCFLYFDWTKGGSLREVTLQTQSIEMAQYNSRLQSNWSELIQPRQAPRQRHPRGPLPRPQRTPGRPPPRLPSLVHRGWPLRHPLHRTGTRQIPRRRAHHLRAHRPRSSPRHRRPPQRHHPRPTRRPPGKS
ncbi:MAG: hypothetical protein O3A87_01445, partial [Verrucomicrobia bacterium]|nr:hypothetical protein [Verrucomicrobiota bacterium]